MHLNRFEMKKTILIAAAALPMLANAHAGHGPVDNGLAHYLLSPLHLSSLLLAAVVAVGGYLYFKNKKRRDA